MKTNFACATLVAFLALLSAASAQSSNELEKRHVRVKALGSMLGVAEKCGQRHDVNLFGHLLDDIYNATDIVAIANEANRAKEILDRATPATITTTCKLFRHSVVRDKSTFDIP